MIPHGIAEVESVWYHPFLFHMSTCLKNLQRTVSCTRQVTPAAPAHLGKSISEGKICPDQEIK